MWNIILNWIVLLYLPTIFTFINFHLSIQFSILSYGYASNDVGYNSPYGYSASVTPQQTMAYDISADYVDSTTYEPRSTMMDPEFISHGSIQEPNRISSITINQNHNQSIKRIILIIIFLIIFFNIFFFCHKVNKISHIKYKKKITYTNTSSSLDNIKHFIIKKTYKLQSWDCL